VKVNVKSMLGRRRSPPAGDIDYLLVHADGSCEVIKALPPPRRTLPSRDRRTHGRHPAGPRYRAHTEPASRAAL
jgi:hypothetical protein